MSAQARLEGSRSMQGNRNSNTRAIVSALKCDHRSLRAAAVELVDTAIDGKANPRASVMIAFDCSSKTADVILQQRAKVTQSGRLRR